jgi:hypothetical protein
MNIPVLSGDCFYTKWTKEMSDRFLAISLSILNISVQIQMWRCLDSQDGHYDAVDRIKDRWYAINTAETRNRWFCKSTDDFFQDIISCSGGTWDVRSSYTSCLIQKYTGINSLWLSQNGHFWSFWAVLAENSQKWRFCRPHISLFPVYFCIIHSGRWKRRF